MGFLSCLLGDNSDKVGEEDEYDVCDEHGHDLRDFKDDEVKSSFNPAYRRYNITNGIQIDAVSGRLLGTQLLQMKKVAPCRDCDYESTSHETIEKNLILREDGEIRTMTNEDYEELLEGWEEEQE